MKAAAERVAQGVKDTAALVESGASWLKQKTGSSTTPSPQLAAEDKAQTGAEGEMMVPVGAVGVPSNETKKE